MHMYTLVTYGDDLGIIQIHELGFEMLLNNFILQKQAF